jgi:hypothetical protein
MKKRIYLNLYDYESYISKNGHNRIDKNFIVENVNSNLPNFLNLSEEIFEGIPNNYSIMIDELDKKTIKFESKSNIEYRLDLLKEPNSEIWHIAFSEFSKSFNDYYEEQTNRGESIDVFSRISWILKDLKMNVEYCIGPSSDQRKNNIYQFMMKFVSKWEKRATHYYDEGWGLFFEI